MRDPDPANALRRAKQSGRDRCEFVEHGEAFPWGAPPTTWDALADIDADARITIGSHTHAHWLMDRLAREEIDADLDQSIELIRDRLGVDPVHFGLIVVLNLMIGLLHPPMGMVLYVLARVARMSLERTTM